MTNSDPRFSADSESANRVWECANANCSASFEGFRPSRCQDCGSEEFYCSEGDE